jgi:hypothetical protein
VSRPRRRAPRPGAAVPEEQEPHHARAYAPARNLQFGVLALQLNFVSRDALVAAMHTWVFDEAAQLGHLLQAQGALTAEERGALDALVDRHLVSTAATMSRASRLSPPTPLRATRYSGSPIPTSTPASPTLAPPAAQWTMAKPTCRCSARCDTACCGRCPCGQPRDRPDRKKCGRCCARSRRAAARMAVKRRAWRATDPKELFAVYYRNQYTLPDGTVVYHDGDPVGPENDRHILRCLGECVPVIAAWGVQGVMMLRDERVRRLFADTGRRVMCLGRTKDGQPRHPLRLRGDTQLRPYWEPPSP